METQGFEVSRGLDSSKSGSGFRVWAWLRVCVCGFWALGFGFWVFGE